MGTRWPLGNEYRYSLILYVFDVRASKGQAALGGQINTCSQAVFTRLQHLSVRSQLGSAPCTHMDSLGMNAIVPLTLLYVKCDTLHLFLARSVHQRKSMHFPVSTSLVRVRI